MKTSYGGSEIGLFERVSLGRIKRSRRMVREAVEDIDDLAASIRENGLLEPIVVRPRGDSFEVVAGNRRLEACRRLRKKVVACHIVTIDDTGAYEMSLLENVQRKNMNAVEEGTAFKKYVDDYGFGGISQLARRLGKSESYVSRRIALLDLPNTITRGVLEGKISPVVAQELISLPKSDAASIGKLALDEGLSREEVRHFARAVEVSFKRDPLCVSTRIELRSNHDSADRVLSKAITAVRVCMMRLDGMIDSLDEDHWMSKEALIESRRAMHLMEDRLIRLKIRSQRLAQKPALHILSNIKSTAVHAVKVAHTSETRRQ